MHFSKIIINKLQFGKNFIKLYLKNVSLPQFSFWIPVAFVEIFFSHVVINCTKIPHSVFI